MLVIRHTLPCVKPEICCQVEQKAGGISAAFLTLSHLATHQPAIGCVASNDIAFLVSLGDIILLAIQIHFH